MEASLINKLKLLTFTTRDIDKIVQRRKERELERTQKNIEKILDDVYSTKLSVVGEKISAEETQETVDAWCSSIDVGINSHEGVLDPIKDVIKSIHQEKEDDKYTEKGEMQMNELIASLKSRREHRQ